MSNANNLINKFYNNTEEKFNKNLKYVSNLKESLRITDKNREAYLKYLRETIINLHGQINKNVKPLSYDKKQNITIFKVGNGTTSYKNWDKVGSKKRLSKINLHVTLLNEITDLFMIYITIQGEKDLYKRTDRFVEKILPFQKLYAFDVILKGRSFKSSPLSVPKSFHSGNTILENILGINTILSVFSNYDCRDFAKLIKGSTNKNEIYNNCHANTLNTLVNSFENMSTSSKFSYNHLLKIKNMSHVEKIKLFRDMNKFLYEFIDRIPPLEKDYTVYFEINVGSSGKVKRFLDKMLLKDNDIQWIIDPDESKMMNKLSYTYLPEALQLGKKSYSLIHKLLVKNFRGESERFVEYIIDSMKYTYTYAFEEEELLSGNSGPKIRFISKDKKKNISEINHKIKGNLIRLHIPAGTKILPYQFNIWKSKINKLPEIKNKKVFLIPPGFNYQINEKMDYIKYSRDNEISFKKYRLFDVNISIDRIDDLSSKIKKSRQLFENIINYEDEKLAQFYGGGRPKKEEKDKKSSTTRKTRKPSTKKTTTKRKPSAKKSITVTKDSNDKKINTNIIIGNESQDVNDKEFKKILKAKKIFVNKHSKPNAQLPMGLEPLLNLINNEEKSLQQKNPVEVISEIKEVPHFGMTRVKDIRDNNINVVDETPYLTGDLENSHAIIMFYAPWCPHCTNFIPEFNRTANLLNNSGTNSFVGAMDCTLPENESVTRDIGIRGYPTLKVFKNGRYYQDYEGPRNGDSIKQMLLNL